jgi:hypothetical protein
LDPYGRHEERWMSEGEPTDLVREEGVASREHAADKPFEVLRLRLPSVC